jgi:catechol 2,3-dioxygenase-like lactoylglutathione lyase family enzyme
MYGRTSKEVRMLGNHRIVAFLATRAGRRARAFYENTLGLSVVSDDDYALALDAGGIMLRIQKVSSFEPHPFTALGWHVSDIGTTVEMLCAAGVAFERFAGLDQDERGVWRSPGGALVAWFKDPDGNTLSLTQLYPRACVSSDDSDSCGRPLTVYLRPHSPLKMPVVRPLGGSESSVSPAAQVFRAPSPSW